MAELGNTRITGRASQSLPAASVEDLVRLGEMEAELSGVPRLGHTHVVADITNFASGVDAELAVRALDSESVYWDRIPSGVRPHVRVKSSGGLVVGAEGVAVDPSGVSRPGHTHVVADILDFAAGVDAEVMAVMVDSQSVRWSAPSGVAPPIQADVRLKTNGALGVDAGGVYVNLGSGVNQAARGNHGHAQLHNPVTITASSTIALVLNNQQLGAEVKLDPTGGLEVTPSGVSCDFGLGHDQVARGDHTHSPALLNVSDTPSLHLSISGGPGDQELSGNVRRDPTPSAGRGRIGENSLGLYVVLGSGVDTAAAGNHGHAIATVSASGFLSPTDKAKLDGLANEALIFDAPLERSGVEIFMPAAASGVDGYMSHQDKEKLDAMTAGGQVWGGGTFTQRVTIGERLVLNPKALVTPVVRGMVEFDGSYMYFTDMSGVRRRLLST